MEIGAQNLACVASPKGKEGRREGKEEQKRWDALFHFSPPPSLQHLLCRLHRIVLCLVEEAGKEVKIPGEG